MARRWTSWSEAGRPTNWSKAHLTDDDWRTLCGVRIPRDGMVHDRDKVDPDVEGCRRCRKVADG